MNNTKRSGEGPLSDIVVLDFSRILVGPYFTRILGVLGAKVIRIEWSKRPDQFRKFEPHAGEPGVNAGGIYHTLNYSKMSCELDITSPLGKEAAFDLIRTADLIIENFRPGEFAKLGFGPEKIRQLNDKATVLSLSGLGHTGPERGYVAYGNSLHGYSGLVDVTGYPGEEGRGISGAWGDPTASLFAGVVALAALYEKLRAPQRKGRVIDLSMVECLITTLVEPIISAQTEKGRDPRVANKSRCSVPQGVLPVDGEDRWVAFSVQSFQQFEALATVANLPGYCCEMYLSPVARRKVEDQFIAELSAWSISKGASEVLETLSRIGIACGDVANSAVIAQNPDFIDRAFLRTFVVNGDFQRTLMGVPWTCSDDSLLDYYSPPRLGQHTDEILATVGYSPDQIHCVTAEATD